MGWRCGWCEWLRCGGWLGGGDDGRHIKGEVSWFFGEGHMWLVHHMHSTCCMCLCMCKAGCWSSPMLYQDSIAGFQSMRSSLEVVLHLDCDPAPHTRQVMVGM